MALTFTNATLTQIAIKRLTGKAHTNSNSSIPQEKYGSTVQSSTKTIFGQSVPNNPAKTEYLIQSASDGGPGTVQYVTFDLEIVPDTNYINSAGVDNDGDYADQSVYGSDLGKTGGAYDVNTFHAYYIKLPTDYEANNGTFDTNSGTDKTLSSDPFSDGFAATGSTQFQVVPEYLSTLTSGNPYTPQLYSTNDTEIVGTSTIDWYFDSFAGILFVQNPLATAGTDSNNNVPETLKAFLYVGKYQSEISAGDSVDLHISASGGTGFSLANAATASFESGSAGITVTADASNTITIGADTDNVTFNTISGSFSGSFEGNGSGLTDIPSSSLSNVVFTNLGDGATQIIEGGLTLTGDITAEQFVVSSSVTYMTQSFSSGSTIFGDTTDDTHEFTGSITVLNTGSGTYGVTVETSGSADGILITPGYSGPVTSSLNYTAIEASGSVLITGSLNLGIGTSSELTPLVIDADGNIFEGNVDILNTTITAISGAIGDATSSLSSSLATDIATNVSNISTNTTNISNLEISASAGIHFRTGSHDTGSSIGLSETASFDAVGAGLTVDLDTSTNTLTYTITPDSVLNGATATSTFNFTSSVAVQAVSASAITVTDNENTNGAQAIVFAEPDTGDGVSLQSDASGLTYNPNGSILALGSPTGAIQVTGVDTNTDTVGATSFISGSFKLDLYHPNSGSFDITNISESTERTPLVIDDNGKVTKADADFATDIVTEGGGITSVALATGDTNQGALDLSVGGIVQDNNVVPFGLGSTDSPTFAGLNAGTATAGAITIGTNASSTVTIGNADNTVTFNGSASIAGDLIVQGTTTTLNTTNLLVEDKFILLNSGTLGSPTDEGGIIVQTADAGTGTALYYDDDAARWIITAKDQVSGSAANITHDITKVTNKMAAVVTVQIDNSAPDHAPFFNAADTNQGQMYVDKSLTGASDNNIWIYA